MPQPSTVIVLSCQLRKKLGCVATGGGPNGAGVDDNLGRLRAPDPSHLPAGPDGRRVTARSKRKVERCSAPQ